MGQPSHIGFVCAMLAFVKLVATRPGNPSQDSPRLADCVPFHKIAALILTKTASGALRRMGQDGERERGEGECRSSGKEACFQNTC